MKSLFRPRRVPDPSILDDHRRLLLQLERRKFVRGGLSLGALSLLTGCDVSRPKSVENALLAISSLNDGVQELLFDPNKLAPTYPASMVLKPPKFNAKYDVMSVKPVDVANWRLELSGKISDKKPWTLQDIAALPQRSMIIKHICVEGWDYIGQWSGVPLRDFLTRVGADLRCKYVAFKTADNYPSSIDMATALHPQTLLALDYADEPLADPFGFPLRLRMSTKLGYKNPKWVTAIEVTDDYPGGYWESAGFSVVCGDSSEMTPPLFHHQKRSRADAAKSCLSAALLVFLLSTELAAAQSAAPGGMPPPDGMSLAQSTAMRFPQPVRVGDLLQKGVQQPVVTQDWLGTVEQVVRDADGTVQVIIRYGGWFGLGSRLIAVPVNAMVLLGPVMEVVAYTPAQLSAFPTYAGGETPLAPNDVIKVGLAKPSH